MRQDSYRVVTYYIMLIKKKCFLAEKSSGPCIFGREKNAYT